ncbi:MAG: ribosomal protein L7/L12, partial [Planctomycetes bacterium]|nr:ribosomal protein L7/L12 [Planctomycetota bacterium]
CGLAEGKAAVERLEQDLAGQAPAGWPPADLPVEQIKALVRDGNLIGAIKAYREATGCGLKEAKDAVDKIAAEL